MAYVNGFRPSATKKQKEFMNKEGIVYRKNVRKGEATILIMHHVSEWTQERLHAEGVFQLAMTDERQLREDLKLIRRMAVTNDL